MSRKGYHMDSSTLFKHISLLTRFGINISNLPKIYIVGQQNEGKTSLIDALTQTNFLPKCDGLCTRKPIYMTLINNHEVKIIVEDTICNEIEAGIEMTKLNLNPNVKSINCTIMSPHVYNCTIVDTIGLIHVSEEDTNLNPKKIKSETIDYLKDKNNIIVLVSSAPSDLANSQILSLIQKHGRTKDTLGVMTKIDLIENQNSNVIADILNGKTRKLGYGWIPTKLRSDRDIRENMTIEQAIAYETDYFNNRRYGNGPHGIFEIRRMISAIQFNKIKSNIPAIILELDKLSETFTSAQKYLLKIIDGSEEDLAKDLSKIMRKLVDSSHDRAKFEASLKNNINGLLLETMNQLGGHEDTQITKLEECISTNIIDPNIYKYHVDNKTVAEELVKKDSLHDMLNSGLISHITLNNETLKNAYKTECDIACMMPLFEPVVDDPLNQKKMALIEYLEKYLQKLQKDNYLQDKIYEITEKMILDYIGCTSNDELSRKFTEYMVKTIGKTAYETVRKSITVMIEIEQRPYFEMFEMIRQNIKLTKSQYLDFTQFWGIRRLVSSPNSNKIEFKWYSELYNRVYLLTVIDRLSLSCFRIIAVKLVDKMVEQLLTMTINLNKETSAEENEVIVNKIELINRIKEDLIDFSE